MEKLRHWKTLICLFGLILAVFGCSTVPSVAPSALRTPAAQGLPYVETTVVEYEVEGYLRKDFGIQPDYAIIADGAYALVNPDWFYGPFARSLGQFYREAGLDDYWPGTNDCDDFTRGAAWLAQLFYVRSSGLSLFDFSALAVGECWYITDQGVGHVILIALVEAKPPLKLQPVFMEPQTQRKVTLSECEIVSIKFLRF